MEKLCSLSIVAGDDEVCPRGWCAFWEPGGAVLEAVRRDGVVTRFDRKSGAFIAFNANGVIRTYFRPNDGERYFRRQLERDH